MLVGGTLAVAVGNHSPDLQRLRTRPRRNLYFSARKHAAGIIDGLRYFGFLDEGDIAALQIARGKSAEAS
jgi:sucrose-phosphate synthase